VLHRRSLGMCAAFIKEIEAESGIKIPFSRCGLLKLLHAEVNYKNALAEMAAAPAWSTRGLECTLELLDPRQIKEFEPEVATPAWGALFDPSVSVVDVQALLNGLTLACFHRKVRIESGAEAVAFEFQGSRLSAIRHRHGRLSCDKLLICAGAWVSGLHPLLEHYAMVIPVRGQALEVYCDTKARAPKHIVKSQRAYVVPKTTGLLALGSTTELESGYNTNNTYGGLQEVWKKVTKSVPALKPLKILRYWAGLRPAGADRKLYLGLVPQTENMFVAAGHYKIGFGFAPLTAQVLAEEMTNGNLSFDIGFLRPRRYQA